MKRGDKKFFRLLTTARKSVIGERSIRTDEYIVTYAQAIPQLHTAFYSDAVANNNIVLNQTVRANIAVLPNLCTGQNNDKLPDAGVRPNFSGLNICKCMSKLLTHQ